MTTFWSRLPLLALWQKEFAGYNRATFQRDLLSGITVGAVCLPLALAFGVAGGADAAAGLVTAILAGVLIGGLGGAAYQISGPTGAMSAVLILLTQRYGLGGVWIASIFAGGFLILLGIFRLGRYIAFIPSPVITGFTSGIAIIIAVGQLDNVLGVTTPQAENALEKLFHYFTNPPVPDWHALVLASVVMLTMLIMPRFTKTIPGSLVGIVLASLLARAMGWNTTTIGAIPQTILLENRLTWSAIPWQHLSELLMPAFSIAALGAVESLLCGSVGATMSGEPFDSNQELIAQGIGNMIIPFFGGVPATAAIARTSVAIKSGGVTRMTSIIHAVVLLLSVFFLSGLIEHIPLAALGGVLLVTAWRMNEWESIRFFMHARLKHAISAMIITMVATAILDLTQAIMIGLVISAVIYIRQSATSTQVSSEDVDIERLRLHGLPITTTCPSIHVYYLSGPLFFGSITKVIEAFETADDYHSLVISMRGVPMIDGTGVQALQHIVEEHHHRGGQVCFSGLQPPVMDMFVRTGLIHVVKMSNIFWSSAQAIVELYAERMVKGCPRCGLHGEKCSVLYTARKILQMEEA